MEYKGNIFALMWKVGIRKALRILRISRLISRLKRFGDFLVFCSGEYDAFCVMSHPDDDAEREEFISSISTAIERDKDIRGVVYKAVTDYLRPLEVETKIFMEQLKG